MMRLSPFQYFAPSAVDEALALASEHAPLARFVAGGTDLLPNMKRGVQTPSVLIGLGQLHALRGIELQADGSVRIGACTTLTELTTNPTLKATWPVLCESATTISTPPLRNMGTLGGNLLIDTRCNYYNQSSDWRKAINYCLKKDGQTCWVAPSSPRCWAVQSSDNAPVMVALGARFHIASPQGERVVAASELYSDDGIVFTKLEAHELLTHIHLPAPAETRATYLKLKRRGSFDFPVLGVAAAVSLRADTIEEARIVIGGVGSLPRIANEANTFLAGKRLEPETIAEAARLAATVARPLDNTDFHMSWRKRMATVYVKRALEKLA